MQTPQTIVNFTNGYYDTMTQNFYPLPEDFDLLTLNCTSTGYNYMNLNENATTIKQVKDYLRQILPDPVARMRVIQFLKSCFIGQRPQNIEDRKIMNFYGSGNNGKTAFMYLISKTFGSYFTWYGSGFPKHLLYGKRLIYTHVDEVDESETKVLLVEDRIRKDNGEIFNSQFSIINETNEQYNNSRRIENINFPIEFVEQPMEKNQWYVDKYFTQTKMNGWLSAFAWILLHS